MPYNRRDFIQTLALAGAALPLRSFALPAKEWEIHCFSKPFQWMDYGLLCETFAAAGLTGVDYTVRPDGHVLPEKVTTDLPKAAAAARKAGLKTALMTTAIRDAQEPYTAAVLKAAAKEGIQFYRMGWYDYQKGKPLLSSLQACAQQLKGLRTLNRELNIRASYQNHAGVRVGASVWDLYEMIKDTDTAYAGVQYDIRHATVEGANSWPLGLELVRPHINTLVIKDAKWVEQNGKYILQNTPLGEGMVNFPAFFKKVKELNIHVPISLHLEYELLSRQEETLPAAQKQQIVLKKLQKDVQTLRGMLAATGL
ncbi:twin-arginine translocation signal domain-containing protein [Chitinophaga lutea]|uniref:Twin-arginine translocation signal domain-containing protein n=1 Tax=Chitinophaga lutea TaxID=2488634 RepID=A0A3N4Q426_9BACT|nr:TIM barrel protein [Chitinophaga lutea]RPE13979.1 twin-arginine translocation signal domain-containing protein [Chitinophaga lutea]